MKQELEKFKQLMNDKHVVASMNNLHGDNNWKTLLINSTKVDSYPFNETGNVSELQCPTLCLVGGEVKREFSAAVSYKQLNPRIHISIIPLAGHLVHIDQPELYARILFTFIDSVKQK